MLHTENEAYLEIKNRIDERKAQGDRLLEIGKAEILSTSESYLNFVTEVTKAERSGVFEVIRECSAWLESDTEVQGNLATLASYSDDGIATGEIRVHAYTFYLLVRLLKPEIIVETGVANGKSSLLLLEALSRNGNGRLISIDVATLNDSGEDRHKAKGLQIGWMVPDRLRHNWDLKIGRSDEVLPTLHNLNANVDIFIHDSLSTYNNMMYEYEQARRLLKKDGLLVSDDIETCSAFAEFVAEHCRSINCFGTLGTARVIS
jgi:Methyltransferase domain